MRRRLLVALLGGALAVHAAAQGAAAPQIEATLAWKGWTRSDRSTELTLRLSAPAAMGLQLRVRAGRQTVGSAVALAPGQPVWLRLAVPAADRVEVVATPEGGDAQQRSVTPSLSESPLLAWAAADAPAAALAGFHRLTLGPSDLPRTAPAYASVDALVLDAASLAALDPAQMAALLGFAADCGRIVLAGADERTRAWLQEAGGCGGRALRMVPAVDQALPALQLALQVPLDSALPMPAPDATAAGGPAWQRVSLFLVVALAALALVTGLAPSPWAVVGVSAVLAVAALGLQRLAPPPAELQVWSEAGSGAPTARYQAQQRLVGTARAAVSMPIPALMAASARPCDARQAVHLEVDARSGLPKAAVFDARLLQPLALCFGGSFPVARALAVAGAAEGGRRVRNQASTAWPAGWLLAEGRVHELPPLAGGAEAFVPGPGRAADTAELRHALSRLPGDGRAAALWPLDLTGLQAATSTAQGWLLVLEPPR